MFNNISWHNRENGRNCENYENIPEIITFFRNYDKIPKIMKKALNCSQNYDNFLTEILLHIAQNIIISTLSTGLLTPK